mmetsp:Transcript_166521/g.529036  ORF Transcript_166521/g.529036 Transcript_166521/m.529036 type:complete len:521 (-) Transcript_166521:635-2197(-)
MARTPYVVATILLLSGAALFFDWQAASALFGDGALRRVGDEQGGSVSDRVPDLQEQSKSADLQDNSKSDDLQPCRPQASTSLADSVLPANDGSSATDLVAAAYTKLCEWSRGPDKLNIRNLDLKRREQLIDILAQAVAAVPPAPLCRPTQPRSFTESSCSNPDWYPSLLSGSLNPRPLKMIDAMSGVGGGAELDLLEVRLYELSDIVDVFVVAESGYNFRGDKKPRLFDQNRGRYEAFSKRIEYVDLDACTPYRDAINKFRSGPADSRPHIIWSIQNAHRNCMFKALVERHSDMPDDTLMIHTDLDEIPSAEAMWALSHCLWATPTARYPHVVQLQQLPVVHNLRKLRDPPTDSWVQGSVHIFGPFKKKVQNAKGQIDLEVPKACIRCAQTRVMRRAGVHLQATTQLAQLMYKEIQHGEGGGLPTPVLKVGGGKRGFCDVSTPEHVDAVQQALQDHPSYWLDPQKTSASLALPRDPPKREMLEYCLIPWVILENPERYPFFWGRGRLSALIVPLQGGMGG